MGFFVDDDVCECVACGCDDNHACSGGCSWVAQNLDIQKGLCSACQRDGLAVLIDTQWSTLNRRHYRAKAVYLGKRVQTENASNKGAAIATTARKIFGPGSRLVTLCDRFSVAVRPASSLKAPGKVQAGRPHHKRQRRTAAAAPNSANTTGSAAGDVGG